MSEILTEYWELFLLVIGGAITLGMSVVTLANKYQEYRKTKNSISHSKQTVQLQNKHTRTDIHGMMVEATVNLLEPLNKRINDLETEIDLIKSTFSQKEAEWVKERNDLYSVIRALVKQITSLGKEPCQLPKKWNNVK